jgi:hypothetical protein
VREAAAEGPGIADRDVRDVRRRLREQRQLLGDLRRTLDGDAWSMRRCDIALNYDAGEPRHAGTMNARATSALRGEQRLPRQQLRVLGVRAMTRRPHQRARGWYAKDGAADDLLG